MCNTNSDCVKIKSDCCGSYDAINKESLENWGDMIEQKCKNIKCSNQFTKIFNKDTLSNVICINNKCSLD